MIIKNRVKVQLRSFLLIISVWLFVALLISSTSLIVNVSEFSFAEFLNTVIYEIICLSPWIVLTPFIINVARKYKFDRYNLTVIISVHAGIALVLFAIHTVVQSYASYFQYNISLNLDYLVSDFLLFLDMRIMLYLGVLLIISIIDFEKRNNETKLRKVRLQNQLNLAKIQALVNKFQPLFFMNCIDAIQHFLKSDTSESENILNNFSDLLRLMLQNKDTREVTVREALETLYLYLDVLESRLGREIEKEIKVGDDCLNVLVPMLSAFIPIMETVLEFVQQKQGELFYFSYKTCCNEKQFRGEISLGIHDISHSALIEKLEDTVFKDLNAYLKTHFGKEGCLQLNNKKEEFVSWALRIPLKRQPSTVIGVGR